MKIAVIGAGLMGASAARHLALAGADVTLIGPEEPAPGGPGPYASHHDAGRITRSLASDPLWAEVARASIARYRALERASGIPFFNEVGSVMAGPHSGPGSSFIECTQRVAHDLALPHDRLEGADLASALPMFRFPNGTRALHEKSGAGTIDPRAYLRASNAVAVQAGMHRITCAVTQLKWSAGAVTLSCADGSELAVDRAILATGAYGDTLMPLPAPLRRMARTVLLVALSDAQVAALGPMPSLIWQPPGEGADYYLLPPVRYPDGRLRLKIGGDPRDRILEGTEQIDDWFRSGGNAEIAKHLNGVLRDVMPSLPAGQTTMAACVTSFTPNGAPMIEQDGPITLCLGGNGAGAKSADELGRRAAALALHTEGYGK